MEITLSRRYSMWNFLNQKGRGICKDNQQILNGIFKGCYTVLWNHTSNELQFFQNFQNKPRSFIGVFKKVFSQPLCLIFFLKQTTDRQMDLLIWVLRYPADCTGLERLSGPPQNKICYNLHPKYTFFSSFSLIFSSAIWKFLFWRNRSYLRRFLYFEGSLLDVIPSFCQQILIRVDFSLVYFMKV